MKGRVWPRRELCEVMTPLRGTHLVIVGFGNVGRWIGRLAKPFGVRITGIRKNACPFEDSPYLDTGSGDFSASADSVLPVSLLDSVLPHADHLVLALPGGAQTDRLMDARRLALLPARAAIYNVGRGNAIDEPALVDALQRRKIAAAYLDVFAREPLPEESSLRSCPNTLLLPHVSAVGPNYLDLFIDELAARLKAEWRSRS
jgi:phosphoglycerate dehydrogenase-like enzyme